MATERRFGPRFGPEAGLILAAAAFAALIELSWPGVVAVVLAAWLAVAIFEIVRARVRPAVDEEAAAPDRQPEEEPGSSVAAAESPLVAPPGTQHDVQPEPADEERWRVIAAAFPTQVEPLPEPQPDLQPDAAEWEQEPFAAAPSAQAESSPEPERDLGRESAAQDAEPGREVAAAPPPHGEPPPEPQPDFEPAPAEKEQQRARVVAAAPPVEPPPAQPDLQPEPPRSEDRW